MVPAVRSAVPSQLDQQSAAPMSWRATTTALMVAAVYWGGRAFLEALARG